VIRRRCRTTRLPLYRRPDHESVGVAIAVMFSATRLAECVKTVYLYSMGSRLVNVRLDEEHVRKAQALRERGVTLSDVVREAIDERFAALRQSESPPDVRAIVQGIFERYPDPADLAPRDYNVHDRRAARAAILRKLRPAKS
jgi:hypothetical protein